MANPINVRTAASNPTANFCMTVSIRRANRQFQPSHQSGLWRLAAARGQQTATLLHVCPVGGA